MALVLVATPGAANANSYLTRAEGDTYFDGHLYAGDWTGATVANKEIALVMATRTLDAMYEWEQFPTATTQALQWPRSGVLDYLRLSIISDTVVPAKLKEATAELAKGLLAANLTADSQVETQGLTALSVGSISLAFKNEVAAKVILDVVANLIPYWWGWIKTGGINRSLVNA